MISNLCNDQNAGTGVETISCILIPPVGTNGYSPYQEIMVPGSKVGLVIGKGGETIKMLQEKTGAKMVIIQDGPTQELVVKQFQYIIYIFFVPCLMHAFLIFRFFNRINFNWQEKPLRISGEPPKVEHAKQLVFDLILDKDVYNNNSRPNFNTGNGAPTGSEQAEVFVPKTGSFNNCVSSVNFIDKLYNSNWSRLKINAK